MSKFQRGDYVMRMTKDFRFAGWVMGTVYTMKGTEMVVCENNGIIYMGVANELEAFQPPPGLVLTYAKGGEH